MIRWLLYTTAFAIGLASDGCLSDAARDDAAEKQFLREMYEDQRWCFEHCESGCIIEPDTSPRCLNAARANEL